MPTPDMSDERIEVEEEIRRNIVRISSNIEKAENRLQVLYDEVSSNNVIIPEQNLSHDAMELGKYTDEANDLVNRTLEALQELKDIVEKEREDE